MADRFWLGTTSTDHNVAANWSTTTGGAGGASVPASGDKAIFDLNSSASCLLSANWSVGGIDEQNGFAFTFDAVTFNTTITDTKDCIFAATGGAADLGTGTLSVSNGTFDNQNVGTFTRGTSTLAMSGTGTIIGSNTKDLWNLTIQASAVTTLSSLTSASVDVRNVADIQGQLILDTRLLRLVADCQMSVAAAGEVSSISTGRIETSSLNSGAGIVENSGIISAEVRLKSFVSGSRLAGGEYSGRVFMRADAANLVVELDASSYIFGSLHLLSDTNTILLANNVNGVTDITVGDLTIDIDGIGATAITITDGATTDWTIQGSQVDQITGGGTFTWNASSGGTITYSGGAASRAIDLMSQTYTDMIVDISGGGLTFFGVGEAKSFDGVSTGSTVFSTDSTLDFTTTNDSDWRAAFDFNAGATALNSVRWTVGGNFTADGQTLNATSTWFLQVDGTARARGNGSVENCDASAGTLVNASGWTDGGSNTNWRFAPQKTIQGSNLGAALFNGTLI